MFRDGEENGQDCDYDCPNPKHFCFERLGARHQHYWRTTGEKSLKDDGRQILTSWQYWVIANKASMLSSKYVRQKMESRLQFCG